MKKINYVLYSPCGNDTGLVIGSDFTNLEKKEINDKIMELHPNVEQVGFLSRDAYELNMAGGEFCGNATRSSAYYYLHGEKGSIDIKVSGTSGYIKSGVESNGDAWAQLPIYTGPDVVTTLSNDIKSVKLEGITHIILSLEVSSKYLNIIYKDTEKIKNISKQIRKDFNIDDSAVGVIFQEKVNNVLKIHPIVWVKSIDTCFYETACGSGTAATSILKSLESSRSISLDLLQPSGKIITAKTTFENNKVTACIISGQVFTDNVIRSLEI